MRPPASADVLILGGGSAGCVLAARISEDPRLRVVLVEAGPDAPETEARLSAYPGRAYFERGGLWPDTLALTGGAGRNGPQARARSPYAQARLLGGGSAINGIGANRGAPSDYDEWGALGAEGWSWEAALPWFRKLERDLDVEGPEHGADGPIPIRRPDPAAASGFAQAAARALAALGSAWRRDQNGPWLDGLHPIALNLDENWRRVSAARGYLTASVRARANLAILPDATALRILFEGRRARGAVVRLRDGAQIEIGAGETVVSAGALRSPALLMASGVGPGEALRGLAVAATAVRVGVGENLMEHPAAGVAAWLPRAARGDPAAHHIPLVERFSSGAEGAPGGDMHLAVMARAAWHAVGRQLGMAFVWVNKSHSRGRVRLTPEGLDVDFRLLTDGRDRDRLAAGFRRAAAAMLGASAEGGCGAPFAAQPGARARRFAAPSPLASAATGLAAAALDLSGPFAPGLAARLAGDAPPLGALLADERLLHGFLDEVVTGVWHACGTCRMGAAADPMAVTDGRGRVHGAERLRVCDASLFPTIPCANLNVPVMMVAERVAADLRADATGGAAARS